MSVHRPLLVSSENLLRRGANLSIRAPCVTAFDLTTRVVLHAARGAAALMRALVGGRTSRGRVVRLAARAVLAAVRGSATVGWRVPAGVRGDLSGARVLLVHLATAAGAAVAACGVRARLRLRV